MLTCYATGSKAQAVRVVEALPDDSFIVEINGKEYRALNADKVREIQKQKIDLDAAQKFNAEKDSQIATLNRMVLVQTENAELQKRIADSFKADFERSQVDSKRNFSLFMSERDLRIEGQQFIPKGNAHGFWGKTLDFLNSQAGQVGFKFVPPLATAVRVFTARCPQ